MTKLRRGAALVLALGLIAAACGDDGDGTDEGSPTTTTIAEGGSETGPSGDSGSGDTGGDAGGGEGVYYTDPRGGIFQEFQDTFDRSQDPFSSTTEFCTSHPAAENRESTDAVEADSVVLVNLRTKLEQLEQIGFALPLGDNNEMYKVFTDYINENCGGIRGRMIDFQVVEVNAQSPTLDADRRAACIEVTEDKQAPIAVNSTGFAGTGLDCLSVEHDTIFITSTSGTDQTTIDSEGRMTSFAPTLSLYTKILGADLVEQGVLEGKRVAVVYPDTPGYPEAIKEGLIAELKAGGVDIVQEDQLGCSGGNACDSGLIESVDRLISNDVDVLFPALNAITLPGYLKEMVTKGIVNGQIQMYQSNYNSQAGDLVSSKVVDFGGEEVAALYDGTIAIDPTPTGDYRADGFEKSALNTMCEQIYNDNNTVGENFDSSIETQASPANGAGTACSYVRLAARILYHAGDNPSRDDLLEAKENLGPVDSSGMQPATFTPGKISGWDLVYTTQWNSPCPGTVEPDKVKSCYLVIDGPRVMER